ncbi:hypothetical protein [Acinetobacter sp.]|uniref:hypothetical protein n=1 Tax=Acinetobacter sp. TaxID=472 RepID=UPI00257F1EB5|nr:hypothetical protein [Acinetobacter sp.]
MIRPHQSLVKRIKRKWTGTSVPMDGLRACLVWQRQSIPVKPMSLGKMPKTTVLLGGISKAMERLFFPAGKNELNT